MITSIKKGIINKHVSNYVQSVLANKLCLEGFSNYKEQNISWFRIKNDELINSIIFHTSWNKLPIILDACCGVYPLFSDVYLTCQACDDNVDGFDFERFKSEGLINMDPTLVMYSSHAKVLCNENMGYGMHTLEDMILPRMNSINSLFECYQHHREWRIKVAAKEPEYMYYSLSSTFIDEAIYLDDQEIYPDCVKRVANCIEIYSRWANEFPKNREYVQLLAEYRMRQHAILDGSRNEYLEILEQRKQKNMAMLKRLSER